jgi:hypothetical protein
MYPEESSRVQVLDLHSHQEVLTVPFGNDAFGFDAQSNFLWVEMGFEKTRTGQFATGSRVRKRAYFVS